MQCVCLRCYISALTPQCCRCVLPGHLNRRGKLMRLLLCAISMSTQAAAAGKFIICDCLWLYSNVFALGDVPRIHDFVTHTPAVVPPCVKTPSVYPSWDIFLKIWPLTYCTCIHSFVLLRRVLCQYVYIIHQSCSGRTASSRHLPSLAGTRLTSALDSCHVITIIFIIIRGPLPLLQFKALSFSTSQMCGGKGSG